MAHLDKGVRSSLRFFAFFVANGTLCPDVLGVLDDYRPALFEYGSALERVFAIYANVLEVDENGEPTNNALAQRRAAQWIRSYLDPEYAVWPPFAEWEIELHL